MPFDKAALDAIDAEILSVFDRTQILAPDDVRGTSETLPDAIHSRGWPTLASCRGKVMFALDNEGKLRDLYLDGHPALRNRLLFVSVPRSNPAAAWMKRNDPVGDFDDDPGPRPRRLPRPDPRRRRHEAISDEYGTQREKALASGAQFVSTDYPEPRVEFSAYCVRVAGGSRRPGEPGQCAVLRCRFRQDARVVRQMNSWRNVAQSAAMYPPTAVA